MKNNILTGIAAAPGIRIAKAFKYVREAEKVEKEIVDDIEEAKTNLNEALEKSRKELRKVFGLAVDKLGQARASILEAQIMILDDPILIDHLMGRIENEKLSPEFIVDSEISKYQLMMTNSSEIYMKERSLDIEDIKHRIIKNLKKKKWKSRVTSNAIIVTENLTPADTVLFSRLDVKGYITEFGGLTSHAAIFSRSLKIPAVVGMHDATARIKDGDTLIIDGYHGEVIINPSDIQLLKYQERIAHLTQIDEELDKLRHEKAITLDGFELKIKGNLDLNQEIDLIIRNGSHGLGLVRTEQLFGDSDVFPDEEEQFEVYSKISEKIYPHNIVIRAFDIGGDKVLPVDFKEPNPMLGWRGIRFLLDNKKMFMNQISAVLRAGIHKNISFMLPMISSIAEIRTSLSIIEECKSELRMKNEKFDEDLKVGIMVEVPSAAIMIYDYASEVDFVSIGTNDLVQYMLAVDRGNEIVSNQYMEYHPSLIRILKFIIDESKRAKVPVSICGEFAAEINAIPLLIGFGLDSVSVSGSAIPTIKNVIRKIKYSDCKALVDEIVTVKTDAEVKEKLKVFMNKYLKEEIGLFE